MQKTDVFINCPFSADYDERFRAIVFAVLRTGFDPRCAREADDAGENRYEKICRIIEACQYGIHDISKTEPDVTSGLPRFNMPFELGLFLGANKFGGAEQKKKATLVLDVQPYRYQQFLSDIAGQDIRAYEGNVASLIEQVVNWLRQFSPDRLPGGRAVAEEFTVFRTNLPELCRISRLEPEEVTFLDFRRFAVEWIAHTA